MNQTKKCLSLVHSEECIFQYLKVRHFSNKNVNEVAHWYNVPYNFKYMALWDVSNRDVLSFTLQSENITEQECLDLVTHTKVREHRPLLVLEIPYATAIHDRAITIIKAFLEEFHKNKTRCVIMAAPPLVEKFSKNSFTHFVSLIEREPIKKHTLDRSKKMSLILSSTIIEGLMQSIESLTSVHIQQAAIIENSQISYNNKSIGCSIAFTSQENEASQVKMGEMILHIPEKTFLLMVNKITGMEYQDINTENQDWVCEFMNMSSVLARDFLNRESFMVNLTLPTLLTLESLKYKFSQKLENVTSTTMMFENHPLFLITRIF